METGKIASVFASFQPNCNKEFRSITSNSIFEWLKTQANYQKCPHAQYPAKWAKAFYIILSIFTIQTIVLFNLPFCFSLINFFFCIIIAIDYYWLLSIRSEMVLVLFKAYSDRKTDTYEHSYNICDFRSFRLVSLSDLSLWIVFILFCGTSSDDSKFVWQQETPSETHFMNG